MLLQAAMLTSCVLGSDPVDPGTDPTVMEISYSIQGAAEQDLTRAVTGTSAENKITGLYSLFFDPTSDGSGNYLGCSYSGVTSSGNQAVGNSRIGMPLGLDAQNAYSMVFIANLDIYVDKGSYPEVGDWLDAALTGKTQQWARENLTATFNSTAGMKSPLLMSGEFDKTAGSNTITDVPLKRAVARVDVNNTSTGNFQMISAQVWNAWTDAFIIDSGLPPAASSTVKYTGNVRNAVSNKIETGLYFFESLVPAPIQNDYSTTCLMIAGYYDNSPTLTYYRVNINEPQLSQDLKRNHIYTIKIMDVKGPGETDIDDAFNKNEVKMEYIVNDWDDDFTGGYATDQYGNRLSVSQRYIAFPEGGGQVEIEVNRIQGTVNPIMTDWSVGALAGVDAAKFTAQKKPDGLNNTIVISTTEVNTNPDEFNAQLTVEWGTIKLSVFMVQWGTASKAMGMRMIPNYVWYSKTPGTKSLKVEILGNFTGIVGQDIAPSVIYLDNPGTPGTQDWVTAITYVPNAADELGGVFNFEISVDNLGTVIPSLSSREADIKFTLSHGSLLLTAYARVRQSLLDEDDEVNNIRSVSINMFYNNEDKGKNTAGYNNFIGIPQSLKVKENLIFSINDKDILYYRFGIRSKMTWRIVADADVQDRLEFLDNEELNTKMNGGGSGEYEYMVIRAKNEMSDDPLFRNLGPWEGSFYIEYENGDKYEIYARQKGVLHQVGNRVNTPLEKTYFSKPSNNTGNASILWTGTARTVNDPDYYYYEIVTLGPGLWLDRPLGAVTAEPTPTWDASPLEDYGKLFFFDRANINATDNACPKGFRMPVAADDGDNDKLRYVWDNMVFIDANGVDSEGISHPGFSERWAIKTNDFPNQYYYPNITMMPKLEYTSTQTYVNGVFTFSATFVNLDNEVGGLNWFYTYKSGTTPYINNMVFGYEDKTAVGTNYLLAYEVKANDSKGISGSPKPFVYNLPITNYPIGINGRAGAGMLGYAPNPSPGSGTQRFYTFPATFPVRCVREF